MLIENTASSVKLELTTADCLKPGLNFNLVISFNISVRDREGLSPGVCLRCIYQKAKFLLCSNGTMLSIRHISLFTLGKRKVEPSAGRRFQTAFK